MLEAARAKICAARNANTNTAAASPVIDGEDDGGKEEEAEEDEEEVFVGPVSAQEVQVTLRVLAKGLRDGRRQGSGVVGFFLCLCCIHSPP